MSQSSGIGKAITENIQFVSKVGAECDHLAKLIREEVGSLLLTPEVARRYRVAGQWIEDLSNDEHGWVYTDLGFSLPVTVKPKRSVSGYIVVQISLTGAGIEATDNVEPLVHIGWWGLPIDFEESLMVFPLSLDTGFDLTLKSERLFHWDHAEYDTEWCFSLYLADINSPADVQASIVKPLKALLLGVDPLQAFSGTRAVRYETVQGEPGHYRVLPR